MSGSQHVKRAIVMFAVLWFLALGSGAVEFLHNAQHAREDAQRRSNSRQSDSDRSAPVHDDTNCPVHAQLHLPLVATPAIVLLICAGLLVAFVTQLAPFPARVCIPARIDCRGPPAC
jgi:hypothetical protein